MSAGSEARRLVLKVGTSSLTYPNGKLNIRCIESLVRVISDLHNCGFEIVLVSSGAVGVGVSKLGLLARPADIRMKQAAAAVGQCELMHIYDKMFLEYGVTVAQVLLTRHNIAKAEHYANVEGSFEALLRMGVVPIVNENDVVSTEELDEIESFGDNDTLSAVVAQLCHADLLIIFTDIEGLYDANPRSDPNARLISRVDAIDDKLRAIAGGPGTAGGTGGMATKLSAAQLCMDSGISMLICKGDRAEVLYDIVEGKKVGTLFKKKEGLTHA
ncbi:MAG: glutamate 5-kinase [Butyricicoccus sp.]|nr:glutamate 5-kinase [Butyricicoccus pullicaecorum]MDY5972678.1 glutamate 5-kinase [Butyricicoccus sp.]